MGAIKSGAGAGKEAEVQVGQEAKQAVNCSNQKIQDSLVKKHAL